MENTTITEGQMENTQSAEKQIVMTEEIKDYLLVTAKWSKFIAIIGFIGLGILILMGLLMMFGLSLFHRLNTGGPFTVPAALYGLLYIIFAGVYVIPVLYLYRFAVSMKEGVLRNDEYEMTNGFLNLKKMSKFSGIMTIVILGLYALTLLIAVPVMFFIASPAIIN